VTLIRGFGPERFIPILAVLMDVLWLYPWFAWIGEWEGTEWSEPPMTLGGALALSVVAEALSHRSLIRNWTPFRTYMCVFPVLVVLLAIVIRLDIDGGYVIWDIAWMKYAMEHQSLVYGGLAFGAILLWRGISAGRDNLSFDDLYHRFLVGLLALILLVVLRSYISGPDGLETSTGLYLLGFFSIGLLSLGLINLHSIRQEMLHRDGSSGILGQRWFSMLTGVVVIILAGSLLTVSAFSFNLATSLIRPLGVLINWVITAFIYIIAVPVGAIVAGLIYILRFFAGLVGSGERPENFNIPDSGELRMAVEGQGTYAITPEALLILKLIIGIMVLLLFIFIIGRALHRTRSDREEEDGAEEVSESLWSWDGFQLDFRSFLSRFTKKFKRQKHIIPAIPSYSVTVGVVGESLDHMLTVSQIYQGLLKEGNMAGFPRRQPETPYEYQERLQAGFPPGEPAIQAITAAYTAHRYGLVNASVEQLGLLNQLWRRLINVIRSGGTGINHE